MLRSTDGIIFVVVFLDFSMYTIVNGPLFLEALACSFVYESIYFSPIMNCSSFCMKEVFKREREKKTKGLIFVRELCQSCLTCSCWQDLFGPIWDFSTLLSLLLWESHE